MWDCCRDRIRTTNNLLGDCYATAIVEHFSKTELKQMDTKVASLRQNRQSQDEDDAPMVDSVLRGNSCRGPSAAQNNTTGIPV